MKRLKSIFILTLCITTFIISCKKDTAEVPEPVNQIPSTPTAGTVYLNFANMMNDTALIFNAKTYTTVNNDQFTISAFKYYISNIKLTKSDGSIYTEANSYHLIDASILGSCNVTLSNIPFGKYTGISFLIGVDSIRNVSGAQTGALDPKYGMIWEWDTGYIMAKLEGTLPQFPTQLLIHDIIGFKGPHNVLKTVSPSFNNDTARVSSTVSPKIYLKTELSEWFKTPTTINIVAMDTIDISGPDAKAIADNYADMISVRYINN